MLATRSVNANTNTNLTSQLGDIETGMVEWMRSELAKKPAHTYLGLASRLLEINQSQPLLITSTMVFFFT